MIQIDTLDQRQRFQKDDLDVLVSIASQAAIGRRQRPDARDGAASGNRSTATWSWPTRCSGAAAGPSAAGRNYHFFDFYESANQVGGDYYDYIELPDQRLAVVLGDVSGKGVSAALLMAKLSGEVRFCLASEPTPAAAMNRINAAFCRSGWDDRFVTFILAVVDPLEARGHRRQRRPHAAAAAPRRRARSSRSARTRPACRWGSTATRPTCKSRASWPSATR